MRAHISRFLSSLAVMILLSGCGGLSKNWDMQGYTVRSGDTLYSIAWRYEKDFSEIAEWNNIAPPYDIYPGQRLIMQPVNADGTLSSGDRPQVLVDSATGEPIGEAPARSSEPLVAPEEPKAPAKYAIVQKNDTLYSISRREGFTHHQIARWNHLKPPYVLKPRQKLKLFPPKTHQQLATTKPPVVVKTQPLKSPQRITARVAKPESLPVRVDSWNWPTKGRVVKTFKSDDTSRKGIGISGRAGQAVVAAAAGAVVYSGNGLINYGNLIIIKHSHSFLSAYAYNEKLLVKEGDTVQPGQEIAKMGSPDLNKAQLHFEIRRNGKPVNPLHYLPKT